MHELAKMIKYQTVKVIMPLYSTFKDNEEADELPKVVNKACLSI